VGVAVRVGVGVRVGVRVGVEGWVGVWVGARVRVGVGLGVWVDVDGTGVDGTGVDGTAVGVDAVGRGCDGRSVGGGGGFVEGDSVGGGGGFVCARAGRATADRTPLSTAKTVIRRMSGLVALRIIRSPGSRMHGRCRSRVVRPVLSTGIQYSRDRHASQQLQHQV
jgi:hypothetical protein